MCLHFEYIKTYEKIVYICLVPLFLGGLEYTTTCQVEDRRTHRRSIKKCVFTTEREARQALISWINAYRHEARKEK